MTYRRKKLVSLGLLAAFMTAAMFTGCGKSGQEASSTAEIVEKTIVEEVTTEAAEEITTEAATEETDSTEKSGEDTAAEEAKKETENTEKKTSTTEAKKETKADKKSDKKKDTSKKDSTTTAKKEETTTTKKEETTTTRKEETTTAKKEDSFQTGTYSGSHKQEAMGSTLTYKYSFTFHSDNTYSYKVSFKVQGENYTESESGTYSANGGSISLSSNDGKSMSGTISGRKVSITRYVSSFSFDPMTITVKK